MKNPSWEAYQLFLAVARSGGLTGASEETGLSPATLGRRMLELEAETGRALFQRSQTGYRLTVEGQGLLAMLSDMEAAAREVDAWREEPAASALVRIAAGTWNAWLITESFPAIRGPRDDFRIELTVAEQRAQMAHRENDIGIRSFEPEERNLAAVPAGEVAYAAYRARHSGQAGADHWVAVHRDEAISSYLRWPHEHRAGSIVVTATRARSLRDLALSGAGIAVLPCFIGDLEPRLERVGDEIPELRHRQWVVMNNDDRHRRPVRTVADRLVKLMKGHAELYAGRRPSRTG